MGMDKDYLVEGAKLKCINGSKCSYLKIPVGHGYTPSGKKKANCRDCKEKENIPYFGECKVNKEKHICKGYMSLASLWENMGISCAKPEKVNGADALNMNSVLICKKGGIIVPETSGQGVVRRINWALFLQRYMKMGKWAKGTNWLCHLLGLEPINLNTGNYIYENEDLVIGGITRLSFRIFYNAMEEGNVGCLGEGWHHNYELHIIKTEEGLLHICLGDGREIPCRRSIGNTYIPVFGDMGLLIKETEGFRYVMGAAGEYTFDEKGLLLAAKDRNGNVDTFLHNSLGQLIQVESANGGSLFYSYNCEGRLIEVKDHSGRTVQLWYRYGKLWKFINSAGKSYTYDYNWNLKLESVTTPRGIVGVKNIYDAANRVIKQITPDGGVAELCYDDEKMCTYVKEQNGNVVMHESDDRYRNVKNVYRDGEEIFEYNDRNLRTVYIDKNGNSTRYYYDTRGNLTAVENALGQKSKMKYDENGNLISLQTANGNKENREYDLHGNLIRKVDCIGRETLISYHKGGCPKQITLPDGSQTILNYDERGNVIKVMVPSRGVFEYEYNQLNKLILTRDGNGNCTKYRYDQSGMIKEVENAEGEICRFSYDESGRIIEFCDYDGSIQKQKYNSMGKVCEVIDAVGNKTQYEYDLMGNICEIKYPGGNTEKFIYNKLNRLDKTISSYEKTICYEYDLLGNCVLQKQSNGEETQMEYDVLSRCIGLRRNGSQVAKIEYNSMGLVSKVTDAKGRNQTFEYDAEGQKTAEIDNEGKRTSYFYNKLGKLTSVIDADGKQISLEYYPGGLLKKIVGKNGESISYQYDGNGNIIEKKNQDGYAVYYAYDKLNRIIEIRNNEGKEFYYKYEKNPHSVSISNGDKVISSYHYSANGKLIEIKDFAGKLTEYQYDALGRITTIYQPQEGLKKDIDRTNDSQKTALVKYERNTLGQIVEVTDALGIPERYEYEKNGKISKKIDREGMETEYEYDSNGLLKIIKYADEKNAEFFYDEDGRLILLRDWTGETQIEWNDWNQIIAVTDNKKRTIRYKVNKEGESTGVIYPNGKEVTYEYDSNKRMNKILYDEKWIDYQYDDRGRITGKRYSNGMNTKYFYTNRDRLSALIHEDGIGLLEAYYYEYDENGNCVSIKKDGRGLGDRAGKYQYEYDAFGSLTEVLKDGKTLRKYTYDSRRNRTSKIEAGDTTTYCYNELNQLIEESGKGRYVEYRYDKRGNVSEIFENGILKSRFVFNAMNRLSEVYDVQGKKCTYTYNSIGYRIGKTVRNDSKAEWDTEEFIVDITKDHNNILVRNCERKTTNYIWDEGIACADDNEIFSYFLRDSLQSPVCVLSGKGKIMERYFYDEFGSDISPENNRKQIFGFTGYQREEENLYFAQAREYMPQIGRFISKDLLKGNIYAPITLNEYSYCMNNPIMLVDRNGMNSIPANTAFSPNDSKFSINSGKDKKWHNESVNRIAEIVDAKDRVTDYMNERLDDISNKMNEVVAGCEDAMSNMADTIGTAVDSASKAAQNADDKSIKWLGMQNETSEKVENNYSGEMGKFYISNTTSTTTNVAPFEGNTVVITTNIVKGEGVSNQYSINVPTIRLGDGWSIGVPSSVGISYNKYDSTLNFNANIGIDLFCLKYRQNIGGFIGGEGIMGTSYSESLGILNEYAGWGYEMPLSPNEWLKVFLFGEHITNNIKNHSEIGKNIKQKLVYALALLAVGGWKLDADMPQILQLVKGLIGVHECQGIK